jgi:hypothetical protein
MAPDTAQIKRLRGAIVEVLYTRHQAQQSRVDHVALWHILHDLGCDVGEYDVLTQLQDLSDRGYLKFEERKDRRTNRVDISLIQLTSRGRDLREETIADPAVTF